MQRRGRIIPIRRNLAQASQAHRVQVARQSRAERTRRDRLGFNHQPQGLGFGLATERWTTSQDLVEGRTQAIDVRGRTDFTPSARGLLGSHVDGSPESGFTQGLVTGLLDELGQAEVGQARDQVFRLRAASQEDVIRLDVAVENSACVGVLHSVGDCGHPPRRQPCGHGLILRLQPAAQARPFTILGGDEVAQWSEFSGVVDPNDVRMIEPRGAACLPKEPVNVARVEYALRQRHLQRHLATEQSVPGADHEPESTRSQVVEDLESAQKRTIVIASLARRDAFRNQLVIVDNLRRFEHPEQQSQTVAALVFGRESVGERGFTFGRGGAQERVTRDEPRLLLVVDPLILAVIRGHGPVPAVRAAWRSHARKASEHNRPRSRASSRSPRTRGFPTGAPEWPLDNAPATHAAPPRSLH